MVQLVEVEIWSLSSAGYCGAGSISPLLRFVQALLRECGFERDGVRPASCLCFAGPRISRHQ